MGRVSPTGSRRSGAGGDRSVARWRGGGHGGSLSRVHLLASWEATILTTVRLVISEMTVEDAGRVFTDPTAYADEPRFHAACALLRREAPVIGSRPRASTRSGRSPSTTTSWRSSASTSSGSTRRARARTEGGDDTAGRHRRRADPHAGPDGRAGSPRVPAHQRRTGSSRSRSPASTTASPSWRSATSTAWPTLGGECDFVTRRRHALPALRHPLAPRPARGRLPADAQAHAGAVRRGRTPSWHAARRRRAHGDAARLLRVLPWRSSRTAAPTRPTTSRR